MHNVFVKQSKFLWNNIENIIIFLFFASFPFNIRKIFLTNYSFLNGGFNEHMTPSFSWASLLIVLFIVIYITKVVIRQYEIFNNHEHLSNNAFGLMSILRTRSRLVTRETLFLYVFLIWMTISVIWSPLKEIAIYRLFIILSLLIFLRISLSLIRKGLIYNHSVWMGLIFGGTIQSLIGVSQFILNRSIGLRFLGESILGAELPGVAKIIVFGEKHIRAYGTFPHPNILAGYLVLQIVIIIIVLVKHHQGKLFTRQYISHETIFTQYSKKILSAVLFFIFLCFIMTFSRSAYLSLFIASVLLIAVKVARSQWHMWLISSITILLILFFGYIIVSHNSLFFLLSNQSLNERSVYSKVSREIISSQPFHGIGLGQFVFHEYRTYPNLPSWQYQPVHNIYLLIASELGIIGLVFFLMYILTYILCYCMLNFDFETLTMLPLCCLVFSYLIIAFFDHYFWNFQQGIIIFSLPLFLLRIETSLFSKK